MLLLPSNPTAAGCQSSRQHVKLLSIGSRLGNYLGFLPEVLESRAKTALIRADRLVEGIHRLVQAFDRFLQMPEEDDNTSLKPPPTGSGNGEAGRIHVI